MGLLTDFFTGELAAKRAFNRYRRQLYEGGRPSRARKSARGVFGSPEDSTDTAERLQLIREARELEDDFPLANLILDTYDIYAIGTIRYQPMTGDIDLNREVTEWLKIWFQECDYTRRFDFQTLMRLAQRGKKRDGEAGIIHMEDGDDYRLRLIHADRIGNPNFIYNSKKTDENGVRVDEFGRVTGYDIYQRQRDGGIYTFDLHVPAHQFSHIFDPHRIDAYHGVSCFKSVVTRMRDLKETMDYSRMNIKYRSTQLPYFKTEEGEIPSAVPNYAAGVPKPLVDKYGVTLEQVNGGEQQFLKTNEGIFEFPNDFPNQQFLPMVETQVKEIMAGVGLSYDFIWRIDKLTGTVGRLVVEREDRVMQNERRKLERQGMRMIINRAIASGVRNGAITRKNAALLNGEFFYGARISADYGRDAKADIELVNAGLLTEAEYQHIHGRNPDDVKSVRMEETLGLLDNARGISDEYGIDIQNALNIVRKIYSNPPKSENQTESITATVEDAERLEMSESYKPTATMASAAERALERRAELPESKRGMTATGIARARDISNRRNLSEATIREMNAWFARHQSTSRESPNYDKREKAWVAWNGWGGDSGKTWAEAIVKRLDKAEGVS